jgi:DNA-binding transcriptional LysR family regulator
VQHLPLRPLFYLPDAVSSFSATNPGIKVTIHDDFFGQALERIANGEVDFALPPINRGKEFQHFQFERLYAEKMVVIVAEDHPLTQENFSLAEIAKQEMVSMPEQTASYH